LSKAVNSFNEELLIKFPVCVKKKTVTAFDYWSDNILPCVRTEASGSVINNNNNNNRRNYVLLSPLFKHHCYDWCKLSRV